MKHQQYDVDLLIAVVTSTFPNATQRVLAEVVNALNALAAPTESDAWK